MTATWQVQTAKQRLSELLRAAHEVGPQVITRHGEEVAVVMDINYFRELTVELPDFKHYLLAGPTAELEILRDRDPSRLVDLT